MPKKRFAAAVTAVLMNAAAIAPAMPAAGAGGTLPGDVNADNAVSTADIVMLQKWLLNTGEKLTSSANADLDQNGEIDVFDLALLKRQLLKKPDVQPGSGDYAALKINEICTSNKNSLKDESGASPDWLELYNAGTETIDLGGIGLSDGKKNRYKFTFPSGTALASGGYLVVLCDNTDTVTATEYHAAFKLSAVGETIYMTAPALEDGSAGADIDIVTVPEMDTDITYGRYTDGTEHFVRLAPTPNASNDTSQPVYKVEKPVFSAEGGFYDAAFGLTLSDDTGNTILYTLDGSDPRISDTAKTYTGSIDIRNNSSDANVWSAVRDISLYGYDPPSSSAVDKGIVVRAVCRDTDGEYSDVAANSYFVGKNAAYYSNMKVVSLTTDGDNLFSSDNGIYMVGDQYYEWKNSSSFKKLDAWSTENPTNYNQSGRTWERPANIQVFEGGQAVYSANIGVRIAGNASRATVQKSLTFYARGDYGSSKMNYTWVDGLTDVNGNKIKSFDKITLRNSSNDWNDLHMRDTLLQSLIYDRDLCCQAQQHCILFINGEFWGMYEITEKLDEHYIESHYGVDSNDCTIMKIWSDPTGSQALVNDYERFYNWAVTADMTDDANYQKVCDTLDIQNLMDYMTFQTYICAGDWLSGTSNNNWAMWRSNAIDPANPYADGKWRFMVYDTEYSTGLYGAQNTQARYDMLSNLNREVGYENICPLFYNLLKNETFRTAFSNTYLEMMEQNFAADDVNRKVDQMVSEIKDAVFATNIRFNNKQSNDSYDRNLNEFKNFFRQRPSYAKQQLESVLKKIENGETVEPTPNPDFPWGWF